MFQAVMDIKKVAKKHTASLFLSPSFSFVMLVSGPNLHTFAQSPFGQKSYQLWQTSHAQVSCPMIASK